MEEDKLFESYKSALEERKDGITKALHGRLSVLLQKYNALTKDECERIDKLDLNMEKRAAEIFRVIREKKDLSAYIGLSRTISHITSEQLTRELFPFISNTWWLQILHYKSKPERGTAPEPDDRTLSIVWLMTSKHERDVAVKVLKEAGDKGAMPKEMVSIEEKTIGKCHCVTYDPNESHAHGTLFPWEKTRLTMVYIEDVLSFFQNDVVSTLLDHFRPNIVALTGTCTAHKGAHVKPGDTVVVTNDSTPWHGELQHMAEIWRLGESWQPRVIFQTAGYYCTAKTPVASPEAMWFYSKMKKCKGKGIVHFAAMGVPEHSSDADKKGVAVTEVLTANSTYVLKALLHLGCYYEVSKYKT